MAAFACAHRGLSAEQPENTLAAFQAAAKAGFPAIECDLRSTADGEVVVLHDAGLERTTGANGRIADMAYDEVRRHPTPAGPVPRLDDVLAAMEDWHGWWNLEIKAPSATEGALQLMAHHHALGHLQVSAMDPDVLAKAHALAPEVPRGLITLGEVGTEEVRIARQHGCRWVNADHEFLDAAAIARLHDAGLRIAAWTVNDPGKALRLAKLGVECIITDLRSVQDALAPQADPKPWF